MTSRQFKAAVKKAERNVTETLKRTDDVYHRLELLGARDAYREVLRLLKAPTLLTEVKGKP